LTVERLVNEPTAAALAYGLDKKKDETIAVYDFGGGTFDISISRSGRVWVEVKSTNGDTHLGGDNVDQKIIDWILEEFKKDQGVDLSKDPWRCSGSRKLPRRRRSSSLHDGNGLEPPFHHRGRERTQTPSAAALSLQARAARRGHHPAQRGTLPAGDEGCGVEPKDIDEVVLVGGQTRMPRIQQIVKELLARSPTRASTRTIC